MTAFFPIKNKLPVVKQQNIAMKKISLVIALFTLVLSTASSQVPAATIPEFTFLKSDKTAFTNKNLATGKPIFFIFFDVQCDHCQRAMSYLNQHHADYKKAAIYLVTVDNEQRVASFMSKYGTNLKAQKNITFLNDFQNSFIQKFKPKMYPSLFLYSAQKKLLLYDDEEKNMVNFSKRINEVAGK